MRDDRNGRGWTDVIDLESLWRDAKANTVVCSETGATKNMVLNAITEGAASPEDVEKSVPLCGGACAYRNPSGRGCRENVEALLAVYLPVYRMMTEDGGCHKKHVRAPEGCTGTRTEMCGGCTGCGE